MFLGGVWKAWDLPERALRLEFMDRIISAGTRPQQHFSGVLRANLLDAPLKSFLYLGGRADRIGTQGPDPVPAAAGHIRYTARTASPPSHAPQAAFASPHCGLRCG